MPELGPYGSVRGALSNGRPYRDLRNVVANYPFEKSRRFAAIQPNFGHGDHSRLSCGVGDTQLGAGFCRDLHGRWPSCGVAEKARIGRDLFRSEDDPPAAKPATPLLGLRWTFRAKRACVVITELWSPVRLRSMRPARDGGQARISRALPVEAIGDDGDGVALALIVANEHRAGLEAAP